MRVTNAGHCCEAEVSDEEGSPDLCLIIVLLRESVAQCGPAAVCSQEKRCVLSSFDSGVTTT